MAQPLDLSRNEDNLKRTITTPQAFGLSFNQLVGGGVVSLTGIAIGMTGGGTSWAYVLATVAVMIISIPYASLAAAMPVAGGMYTYVSRLIHPGAGFFSLWIFILMQVTLSLYGLAAGSYLRALDPWFNEAAVAVVLVGSLFLANLLGTAVSGRLGMVLAGIKLVAFGSFIAFGLVRTDFGHYPPLLPAGFGALLQAAALLTFATGGATMIAELGREMKTPGRTIPIAILGSTALAGLIYVLIALPAAGVLPIPQVADQPLSLVAETVMPAGGLLFFILGGAVVAVIGTLNTQLMSGSKSLLMAIDDGWFPRKLGAVNRRFGTPHWLLSILFVVGIAPALLHVSIGAIATAASSIAQLSFILVMVCALRLQKVSPAHYAASPFRLHPVVNTTFVGAGIAVCLIQGYLLSATLGVQSWLALAGWFGAGGAWFMVRYPYVKRLAVARLRQLPESPASSEISFR